MGKIVKRGYVPSDERDFSKDAVNRLRAAGRDLYYLLNQGYHIKGASVFVGNHYLLSERQRLAMVRAVSSKEKISLREEREIKDSLEGCTVHIDGFNLIITLEVALSGSPLLKCMDGTVRDLAGLRGTYRMIDKTDLAISHIGRILESYKIKKAVFYLDSPVSNSGRLRERITDILCNSGFEVQVNLIHNVDTVLKQLDYVITGDAIILDNCISWFNLAKEVIETELGSYPYIDLGTGYIAE